MTTRFLARLMGLWMMLTVAGLVISRRADVNIFNALFTEPGLMFVAGVFTMLFGLVVVLTHNRWKDGALAFVVTLLGWLAMLKGFVLAALPPRLTIEAFAALNVPVLLGISLAVAFVIGVVLTYAGFRAESKGVR